MNVRVRFFAYFRNLFGGKDRVLDLDPEATVRRVLLDLCDTPARRSEIFEGEALKANIIVMINGVGLPASGGLETALGDGDVVSIFPLMGGG